MLSNTSFISHKEWNFEISTIRSCEYLFVCLVLLLFFFSNVAAIQALKRKSRFVKQLQQIDGTLSTIEMQREALEDANSNMVTITSMKNAAEAMKIAHQNLYVDILITFSRHFELIRSIHRDADKIRDIMDEVAEQQDISREISEAISTSIGFGKGIFHKIQSFPTFEYFFPF